VSSQARQPLAWEGADVRGAGRAGGGLRQGLRSRPAPGPQNGCGGKLKGVLESSTQWYDGIAPLNEGK